MRLSKSRKTILIGITALIIYTLFLAWLKESGRLNYLLGEEHGNSTSKTINGSLH